MENTPVQARPVRDRRRGKRILTLRNGIWFSLALVVVFALISVFSEFHHGAPGDYGRLYETRAHVAAPASHAAPVIVSEDPVKEETFADPLSLDTINREQVLGVNDPVGANSTRAKRDAMLAAQATAQPQAAPTEKLGFHTDSPEQKKKARIAISGGAAGVQTTVTQ